MLANPRGELLSTILSGRDRQHDALGVVYRCIELLPVQEQHRLHRRMPDPLVAVHKGVIRDERESERRRLRDQVRIEILAAERLAGLSNGGFQQAQVADAGDPPD